MKVLCSVMYGIIRGLALGRAWQSLMGSRSVLQGQPQPVPVQLQYWNGEALIFRVSSAKGVFAPDDVVAVLADDQKTPVWLGQVDAVSWEETSDEHGITEDAVTARFLWGHLSKTLYQSTDRVLRLCRWSSEDVERFLAQLASQQQRPFLRVGKHGIGFADTLTQCVTAITGNSVGGKQVLVAAVAQQMCQHGTWILDPTGQYSVPNEQLHRFNGQHGIGLKDVGWVTLANYLGYQFPHELQKSLWDWFASVVPELQKKPFWTIQDFLNHARGHQAMPLIEADLNRLSALRIFASDPSTILPINRLGSNANTVHRLDVSTVPEPWRGLVMHWMVQVWQRHAQALDKKPYVMIIQPEWFGDEAYPVLSELNQLGFGMSLVTQEYGLEHWAAVGDIAQKMEATHCWLLESVEEDVIFHQPDANHLYDVQLSCYGRASFGLPLSWAVSGHELMIHQVEPCQWDLPHKPKLSSHLLPQSPPSLVKRPNQTPALDIEPVEVTASSVPVLPAGYDDHGGLEAILTEAHWNEPDSESSTEFLSHDQQPPEVVVEKESPEWMDDFEEEIPLSSSSQPDSRPKEEIMGLDDLQDALDAIDARHHEGVERENSSVAVLPRNRNNEHQEKQVVSSVVKKSPADLVRKIGAQGFKVGDRVTHSRYGEGTVDRLIPTGKRMTVRVMFDHAGKRLLDAEHSGLEALS